MKNSNFVFFIAIIIFIALVSVMIVLPCKESANIGRIVSEPAKMTQIKAGITGNWIRCQKENCEDNSLIILKIYEDGTYFMRGGNRIADQGGIWTETRIAKVIDGKWVAANIIEFRVKMGQEGDQLSWFLKIREDGNLSYVLLSDREPASSIPLTGDELVWVRE